MYHSGNTEPYFVPFGGEACELPTFRHAPVRFTYNALAWRKIPFDVVLKKPMIAEITTLAYSIAGRLHCSQRLMLGAPSSNSVRLRSHTALDHSPQTIRLRAMECHSSLQCRILDIPHTVYDGESAPVTICLENDGLACIQDVSLCIKSHRSIKSPYVTAFKRSGARDIFPVNNV